MHRLKNGNYSIKLNIIKKIIAKKTQKLSKAHLIVTNWHCLFTNVLKNFIYADQFDFEVRLKCIIQVERMRRF